MDDKIFRLSVQRTAHATLDHLFSERGFNNQGHGWDSALRTLMKVRKTKVREIELVIFQPTKAERVSDLFVNSEPPVYAHRGLAPASLFELMAPIPSQFNWKDRKQFFAQFGTRFFIIIHGHFTEGAFGRVFPWLGTNRIGVVELQVGAGLITDPQSVWYAGFRTL